MLFLNLTLILFLFLEVLQENISPNYVEINVGQRLLIHCDGYSISKKTIWIFDKPTLDHHLTISKNHTSIVFNNITVYDTGTYTCIVNNAKNTKKKSFFARAVVKVFGKVVPNSVFTLY